MNTKIIRHGFFKRSEGNYDCEYILIQKAEGNEHRCSEYKLVSKIFNHRRAFAKYPRIVFALDRFLPKYLKSVIFNEIIGERVKTW